MKKLSGLEELARFRRTVMTRDETRAEADALFGDEAVKMRKLDREKVQKLFVQAPAAVTMAPNLQKQSYVVEYSPELDEGRAAKQGRIGGGILGGTAGAVAGHHAKGLKGALVGGALGTAAGSVAGHFGGKHSAKAAKEHMMSNAREKLKMMDQLRAERSSQAKTAPQVKTSSITPSLDSFFEKLSAPQWDDAQLRYPELQKVAYATVKSPDLKKRPVTAVTGEEKRQSDLSGGSA